MKKILIELVFLGILLLCFTTLAKADKNTYISDTDDGYIFNINEEYVTCWGDPTGSSVIGGNIIYVGQIATVEEPIIYTIYRIVLFFDTSNLDMDLHKIVGANLRFYIQNDNSLDDFKITAQKIECSKPAIDEDYNKDLWSGNYGFVSTGDIQPYSTNYMEIELSQEWIDEILKYDDYSIIGLRSSQDIERREPITSEYVILFSGNAGSERYRPQLRIYYTDYITFSGSTWFNVTESNTSANCSVTYNYWEYNSTFLITGDNDITAFGNVTGYTWEELILISTPCIIVGILVTRIKRKKEGIEYELFG